jgi:hypothetical protein
MNTLFVGEWFSKCDYNDAVIVRIVLNSNHDLCFIYVVHSVSNNVFVQDYGCNFY